MISKKSEEKDRAVKKKTVSREFMGILYSPRLCLRHFGETRDNIEEVEEREEADFGLTC